MCAPEAHYFCASYLNVGLLPMSKFGKGRSRSPRPRFGYVEGCDAGRIWCTHSTSQFLNKKKSASVAQTYVALVVAAGAAGGEYIANTGHCGFAYKNTVKDLKRVVLKTVQVPQPCNVTTPTSNNKTGLLQYEDHPVMLPHELIYYLVCSGRTLVSDLADMTSRMTIM